MTTFRKIRALAQTVRDAGGRALLVGGCVRDVFLGLEPKDWDLEVYGLAPATLRSLLEKFGRVDAVGEAFTVYKIGHDLDVALPRRERKTGRGHRGFVVEGDPQMSYEEACRRRDFTINAILQDPLTDEIIDPYDGRGDIIRKIIRHIAPETFIEDSLRVLRAAQFAARFEFEIANDTVALCQTIDLTDLPKERVWGEMEKLLMRAQKPSIGFIWLQKLGVMAQLFPELKALEGVPQEYAWHPEGDVDIHTWLTVDYARTLIDDLPYAKQVTVMLGALCHDLGKPATTEFVDGRWRSLAHEEAGVPPTETFLERLNINTIDGYDVRGQVIALVRDHLKPGAFYKKRDEIGDGAFRRLARRCELDLLCRVSRADNMGRNAPWVPSTIRFTPAAQDWFIAKARELAVENKPPAPILLGRHLIVLGVKPGPGMGKILAAVYEQQLDGQVTTLEEAETAARAYL